jgi:hypothetical protein
MPRLDMPSQQSDGTPNWVEYRDKLMAGDRFLVQAAARVQQEADGSAKTSFLEMNNDMRNTLLGRIITAWSYPCSTPAQAAGQPADLVIGNAMDLDDYSALEKAVEPLMDKISGRGPAPDPKPATAETAVVTPPDA